MGEIKVFFIDENRCFPSDKHIKRYADDFIVPPYYNPKNYLYPYGINMPPFPFYNAYGAKQSKTQHRNKMGNFIKTKIIKAKFFFLLFLFRMGSLSIS